MVLTWIVFQCGIPTKKKKKKNNPENEVVCLKLCTVAIGQELVVEDRSTMDVIKVIEMTKSVSCCTVNGLLLATYS